MGENSNELENEARELKRLTETAGGAVVEVVVQSGRKSPNPATFFGLGKLKEIARIAETENIDTVVINNEITPSQQRNIEHFVKTKIIDYTHLILDIFVQHAHTSEGKLQVELAQLNYMLPRIRGKGIELSRLGGGIGTRGPGETKLEVDRRRIEKGITRLKKELGKLEKRRHTQRKLRIRRNIPVVTLVGYTNAGKSSLINALTGSEVLVEDMLFATLDSTTKKLTGSDGANILITDTVGFINKLPHQLIEAFKSTLSDISAAWLLIHIIDASNPQFEKQKKIVEKVLDGLGVSNYPRIDVFNKTDVLSKNEIEYLSLKYKTALLISAKTGEGIDILIDKIKTEIESFSQGECAKNRNSALNKF